MVLVYALEPCVESRQRDLLGDIVTYADRWGLIARISDKDSRTLQELKKKYKSLKCKRVEIDPKLVGGRVCDLPVSTPLGWSEAKGAWIIDEDTLNQMRGNR